ITSQTITRVGISVKASIMYVEGSGMRSMSLSLIAAQPRMDEPSMPNPSSKEASVSCPIVYETCCHRPGKSVKRRSSSLAPFFFANSRTVFASAIFECSFRKSGDTRKNQICGHTTLSPSGCTIELSLGIWRIVHLLQSLKQCRYAQFSARRSGGEIDCFYRGDKDFKCGFRL